MPTGKRQLGACLDTLRDSCFEPAGTWLHRSMFDRGISRTTRQQPLEYAGFPSR